MPMTSPRPAPLRAVRLSFAPLATLAAPPACSSESTPADPSDPAPTTTAFEPTSTSPTTSTSLTSTTLADPPFDPTPWLGRYHYELPHLPFGHPGDPMSAPMLINLEILADATASMLVDDCTFLAPFTIAYAWTPDEPGWLSLQPGAGETSLRFSTRDDLQSLRVLLVAPCRELYFEVDGTLLPWKPFRPGASCWVDRCTTGDVLHVDYCKGEDPPPCP